MAKVVTLQVDRSVVTGIRVDGAGGRLVIESADIDAAGETVKTHVGNIDFKDLPGPIATALGKVVTHAQTWADNA